MFALLAATLLVLCVAAYAIHYLTRKETPTASKLVEKQSYSNKITPISSDFKWDTQEPEKYRPMKNGVYKMTMGIKNLDYDDYILFDKNYVERTNLRVKIAQELPEETILLNPIALDSIREYYDFVMNFYLQRFPMIFQLQDGLKIYNSAREEYLPLNSIGQDAKVLLELLGRHMEDDFLILLKTEDEGEYILRAGISLFPNGFSPLFNMNKHLSLIHDPVPQYESKLKLAMNKFFDRVSPYQFVYRVNWGVQPHTNLCALTGNHGKPQEYGDIDRLELDKCDFNKIFLRSERQVLTRMPQTGAVVLSLKTYVTPLTQIRDEGLSETLIGAIEKLPLDIALYKNLPKWGDAVILYMKGESNGITDEKYEYVFTT